MPRAVGGAVEDVGGEPNDRRRLRDADWAAGLTCSGPGISLGYARAPKCRWFGFGGMSWCCSGKDRVAYDSTFRVQPPWARAISRDGSITELLRRKPFPYSSTTFKDIPVVRSSSIYCAIAANAASRC